MIVGIGGVSRSGKSQLAKKLGCILPNTLVINLDDFAFPEESLAKIGNWADWEIPESYDYDRLIDTIEVATKNYDHIIVEGILVFYHPGVNALLDKRIYLKIYKSVFLKRRKEETRWGKEPVWLMEYVWDSHVKYGKPAEKEMLNVDNNKPFNIDEILAYLDARAAK